MFKVLARVLFFIFVFNSILFASIGNIKSLKGTAYISNKIEQKNALVGMNVNIEDTIFTEGNSSVSLLFKDNTIVTLGKNSTFIIKDYLYDPSQKENNSITLELTKGILKTITGQIGKINPSKFKLKAKSATIGIRGTTYIVEIDGDLFKVAVIDGSVLVEPFDPNIEPFIVNKDSFVTFDNKTGKVEKKSFSTWKKGKEFNNESKKSETNLKNTTGDEISWNDSSIITANKTDNIKSTSLNLNSDTLNKQTRSVPNEVDNNEYKDQESSNKTQTHYLSGKHLGGVNNSYIDTGKSNVKFDGNQYQLDYYFDWYNSYDNNFIKSKYKKKIFTHNNYTKPDGLNYTGFNQIDSFSYKYEVENNIYLGRYNVWADNLGEFVVTTTDSSDTLQDMWYAGVTNNYIEQPNTLFKYAPYKNLKVLISSTNLDTSPNGSYYYNNSFAKNNFTYLDKYFYIYGAQYISGNVEKVEQNNKDVYSIDIDRHFNTNTYYYSTSPKDLLESTTGTIYGSNFQGIGMTTDREVFNSFGSSTSETKSSNSQYMKTAYLDSKESYSDSASAKELNGYMNLIKSSKYSSGYILENSDDLMIKISGNKDSIIAISNNFGSFVNSIKFGDGKQKDHYYVTEDLFGVKLNSSKASFGSDNYTANSELVSASTLKPVTAVTAGQSTHSGELSYNLNGDGFVAVELPSGEKAYTNDLTFSVSSGGKLKHTASGLELSSNIVVSSGYSDITISSDGTVSAQDRGSSIILGQISLYILYDDNYNVASSDSWLAIGDNLYIPAKEAGSPSLGSAGYGAYGSFEKKKLPGGYMIAVPDSIDSNDNFTMLEDESSWGYWRTTYTKDGDSNKKMEVDPRSTWVAGTKTDPTLIQKLIDGKSTTMKFKGHVLGAVSDSNSSWVDPIVFDKNNNANFKFDFGGGKGNFEGNIGFKTNSGKNWSANIGKSSAMNNQFSTTNISGTGDGSKITSGSLQGSYYGTSKIKSVGGQFQISNGTKDASGVFKAVKQ